MKINKAFLLLTSVILPLSLVGCNKNAPVDEARIITSIPANGKTTEYLKYNFDLANFTNLDGEYNKDITRMSLLFCSNTARSSRVEFKNTKHQPADYQDKESFYKHFEFSDFETNTIDLSSYEYDKNDGTTFDIAHKIAKVNGENYDFCFMTIEDTGSSGTNWASNFDVGVDSDEYYSKTGEHPEWANKQNHKGFDIAANRCLDLVENYQFRKINRDLPQIYIIFGHSRGGAIANLVAAKMIDLDQPVLAYTLASPATTTDASAHYEKYKNIHNVICENDIVTNILLEKWGFTRFGQTTSFDIKDYKKSFEKLNDATLPDAENSIVTDVLYSVADTREELYIISDKFTVATSEPLDESGVTTFIARYSANFEDNYEALKAYVEFERIPAENDLTIVKVKTCPAFLIGFVGAVMASGSLDLATIANFAYYLNAIFKVSGKSVNDLRSLNITYIIYCHYYQSYVSYFWAE